MVFIHGYWNIRGYSQPIRLLLAEAGVKYEDKRYNYGSDPETLRAEWLSEKFTLGLDFPNLPYLFDGDVRMTQSIAILRYLGAKYNLSPTGDEAIARVFMIEQQIVDWRSEQNNCFYNDNYDNVKDLYVEGLKSNVRSLSAFLSDYEWLSGNALTYVDFLAYEWLDVNRLFYPELLNGLTHLEAFHKRVESLPNVAAYMKSDKFIKWPVNGIMAKWGGK